MSRPYRPSNGTEGMMFNEDFCDQCRRDNFNELTGKGGCQILADALWYDIDDPKYPKEWVEDDDGKNHRCTAFEPEKEQP